MLYCTCMQIFDAVMLGIVQGVTEFLPLSSLGHLVLVRQWLSIDAINALAFDAVLHLTIALVALIYFWPDIWTLSQSVLRKLSRLPVNQKDITLFNALVVGCVPGVLVGALLQPYIESKYDSAGLIAGMLLLSAIFLMYVEWRYYLRPNHENISVRRGWLIGIFQVLAMIPGFPQTGATMAGGMQVGLSRYDAARFSFMLVIPISLGVGIHKIIALLKTDGVVSWNMIGIGAAIAAVVSFFLIRFFLSYIKQKTLWPFIWYNVILAALVAYVNLIS
jgi:undecaprenyl-diphosphatase